MTDKELEQIGGDVQQKNRMIKSEFLQRNATDTAQTGTGAGGGGGAGAGRARGGCVQRSK